jgi:hypothetical protein
MTVHPWGEHVPGVPVLIRMNPDGSGSVIGGAKGKLQHLRLTKLKSPSEAEMESKAKRRQRTQRRIEQRKEERKVAKERGITPETIKAKQEEARQKVLGIERDRVSRVAKHAGWDEKSLQPSEEALEGKSEKEKDKIHTEHHRMMATRANQYLRNLKKGLAESATARAEASIGEETPEGLRKKLKVADVIPQPGTSQTSGTAIHPLRREIARKDRDEVAAEVRHLDPDELRTQIKALQPRIQEAETVPTAPITPEGMRRAEERQARVTQALDELINQGDMYGARRLVTDAILEYEHERPERAELAAEKIAATKRPDLSVAFRESIKEASAARRRAREAVQEDVQALSVDPKGFAGAAEILAEEAKIAGEEREARRAKQRPELKAIEEARGSYMVTTKEMTDKQAQAEVAKNVENASRAQVARSLMKAAEGGLEHGAKTSEDRRKHQIRTSMGIGAHQALSNASHVLAMHGGLEREAVDVLGIAGSAQLLGAHLHATMSPEELSTARQALRDHHIANVEHETKHALKVANETYEAAKSIGIPEQAGTGEEIMHAMELTERKKELLAEAREMVGLTLGKYESLAALQVALDQGPTDIRTTMSNIDEFTAHKQMEAIGLSRGDYNLEHDGTNAHIAVNPAVHSKMVRPLDAARKDQATHMRDVKAGQHDEEGWIPTGFAQRPAATFEKHGEHLPDLRRDFKLTDDVEGSVREYAGSRIAHGEPVWEVYQDLRSNEPGMPMRAARDAGKGDAFAAAMDELAPTKIGHDEKALALHQSALERHRTTAPDPESPEHEAHAAHAARLSARVERAKGRAGHVGDWQKNFDQAADDFAAKHHPGHDPIHRQKVDVSTPERQSQVAEALHRSIATNPALKAAFKNPADMENSERRALREWFSRTVIPRGTSSMQGELTDKKKALENHLGKEPEKERAGLFGVETTPEWTDWKKKHDEIASGVKGAKQQLEGLTWGEYVEMIGSSSKAMEIAAEHARGHLSEQFAHHHERITGDKLRTSQRKISHDDLHDVAVDPKAAEELRDWKRKVGAEIQRGEAGRWGSNPVKERLAKLQSEQERLDLAQGTLLGPAAGVDVKHPRTTLGHATERQLAGMIDAHFGSLDPHGKPFKVKPDLSVFKENQRIIKAGMKVPKMAVGRGVGGGKTWISFGLFTGHHDAGRARRGLWAVPAKKVADFNADAVGVLEPGKYKMFNGAGTSREQRLAAYKDPSHHMVFVSHENIRDDVGHMIGKAHGMGSAEARDRIMKATPEQVDEMVSHALKSHGADSLLDHYVIDEGHQTLNRAGKKDSFLAKISDSMMRQSKQAYPMSGTLAKNDMSEVQDIAAKLDHEQHGDRGRFMRRFDVGTTAATESLRREMDRLIYSSPTDAGTRPIRPQIKVDLHPEQKKRLQKIDTAYGEAREAMVSLRRGLGDRTKNQQKLTDAVRRVYPKSFANVPAADHQRVAQELGRALGTLREQAHYSAIHGAPGEHNAKIQQAVKLAKIYKKNDPGEIFDHMVKLGQKSPEDRDAFMKMHDRSPHKGKEAPGLIFVRDLESVKHLKNALQKEGIRAAAYTGGLNQNDAAKMVDDFKGRKHDVMVVSDAGAAGLNLQHGRYSIQMDTPMTHKTWEQRSGRINRSGQKEEEPHQYDLIGDHKSEHRARERMLRKKGLHEVLHGDHESLDDTGLAAFHNRLRTRKKETGDDPFPHIPELEKAA